MRSRPQPPPVLGPTFELRTAPRQWPGALRAAVCMGVPVLVGWLAGDFAAGLTATMGGFTALYGSGRPYFNRAILLAGVTLALSAAVGLGIWAASVPWLGVLVVIAIATLATLLCNALEVGPPGAYQFALVCAMGTGIHADHDPARIAGLVLAGGSFAWLVHMAGAVFGLREPERTAVATSASAVAEYVDSIDTAEEVAARHLAAQSLYTAYRNLHTRQPRSAAPSATVRRLQGLTFQLHLILLDSMRSASTRTPVDSGAADAARAIARQAFGPVPPLAEAPVEQFPPARPGAWTLIKLSVQPRSRSLIVVVRVAVATASAGALAGLLGLEHAYWAMTAAAVMLHQGLDRQRTTQRALRRLIGTWAGLVLAAAIIAMHPQALWLVAVIMALNYFVELTAVSNYTLSVVLITALAMVISTSTPGATDLGSLFIARGVDTAVGCATAVMVFWLFAADQVPPMLSSMVADTLDSVGAAARYLTPAAVTTAAAVAARRDMQTTAMRLIHVFVNAIDGSPEQHRAAEPSWPMVLATQRLVYRTAIEARRLGRCSPSAHLESIGTRTYLINLRITLGVLARTVRAGEHPPGLVLSPGTLSDEVGDLCDALARRAI